jgi:hypothetical protein
LKPSRRRQSAGHPLARALLDDPDVRAAGTHALELDRKRTVVLDAEAHQELDRALLEHEVAGVLEEHELGVLA